LIERFLVVFTTGESELFEWSNVDDSLTWIESEKAREHDCDLAGYDYNPTLKLLVTGDRNGSIRIWNRDKKFLREILFPDQIDSVCFLNDKGDLMVSHSKRISKIEFGSYWTKIFDYYGITKSKDDPTLAEIAGESIFGDTDFIVEDEPAKRVKIES
jgi:WD40 repeat protein